MKRHRRQWERLDPTEWVVIGLTLVVVIIVAAIFYDFAMDLRR